MRMLGFRRLPRKRSQLRKYRMIRKHKISNSTKCSTYKLCRGGYHFSYTTGFGVFLSLLYFLTLMGLCALVSISAASRLLDTLFYTSEGAFVAVIGFLITLTPPTIIFEYCLFEAYKI